MSEWYIAKDGEKSGPVSTSQLKEMAASGLLLPTDKIWCEGLEGWALASMAKGLIFASAQEDSVLNIQEDVYFEDEDVFSTLERDSEQKVLSGGNRKLTEDNWLTKMMVGDAVSYSGKKRIFDGNVLIGGVVFSGIIVIFVALIVSLFGSSG